MMRIPFSKVQCSGNERRYLEEVLQSGWLTTGAKAREFELQFGRRVEARHACAVNSCTAALHLALEGLGVGPGDKVLVPTLTFTATAEVIRYLGADPVFLDVDYRTGLLTPAIVEQGLREHPSARAVVVVHFGGQAAEVGTTHTGRPGILDLCRRYGARLVEDAAHAFPTRARGRMVGSLGDATCFSFYANKTITTGEGGLLATNDDTLYARAKVMRLHGIDRDVWHRFTSDRPSWEYDVVAPGYKYNLPDLNAAVGLAQLEAAESLRASRQRCFEFYLEELGGCEALDLPLIHTHLRDHSCHLFWVVLREDAPLGRDEFIRELAAAGVGTSVHYKPLHRMTYYRDRYRLRVEDFPNAERHWRGCVSLPAYPSLTKDELNYVVRQVKAALDGSSVRARRLAWSPIA